jgi:putative transposase
MEPEVDHGKAEVHAGAAARRAILEDLRASKTSKAADLVEQAVHETLTYYAFPDIHWQKIRTNNPPERIMREIRRRTVGAFPDGQSCLNLAAAGQRFLAGTAWSTKRYMKPH